MDEHEREYKVALKRVYEKKAEWAERLALAFFISLVLGQIVKGIPFFQLSVVVGVVITVVVYKYANYLLDKSK
jgi:hypothetical protein